MFLSTTHYITEQLTEPPTIDLTLFSLSSPLVSWTLYCASISFSSFFILCIFSYQLLFLALHFCSIPAYLVVLFVHFRWLAFLPVGKHKLRLPRPSASVLTRPLAMNLLLVLPVALAMLSQAVQGKSTSLLKHKDAKCDLKKADRCTQILYVYGDPNYQMSNTVEEAEQFCK